MSYADAGTKPVRRFEVFTGAGRRRDWSDEEKVAIVAESYSGLESVCAVARRHGLELLATLHLAAQIARDGSCEVGCNPD
ncbi:transposase [Notoacmeibacter ruber]|uniref:transposase n=1 Tax=Notoacmeibacter ruber TaxID=2670375 RepID=UPI001FE20BBD|nr:transposase [Notoacmeibacter ruber]